ncbi:MAG: hypothetical protein QOE00_1435 [Ilumatobacteraceae bacterium]
MTDRPTDSTPANEHPSAGGDPSVDESSSVPAASGRPSGGEANVDEIDPDAPARSLFDNEHDAVEPNEPA